MVIRCLFGHKPIWKVWKSIGMTAKELRCERCGKGLQQKAKYQRQHIKEQEAE